MAKTQLIRKSFNAGELSPELHYRDDLAAYVKGCKHLTNMIPTPYGAVTRRPPFEVLSKIDHALYGVPVRYIPFKFSLTEVFHIVFTDGSGSQSTDPTTADLIIFDEFGTQVIFDGNSAPFSALPLTLDGTTLEGASTLSTQGIIAMATTIYDPANLHEIHFINVNDFVYLTCGGKYPVQAINRFFDEEEGGNRWRIDEFEFIGGPLEDRNENQESSLSITAKQYSATVTYSEGDFVANSDVFDVTNAYWVNIGGDFNKHNLYFTMQVGHGISVGDVITVSNFGMTDGGDFYSTETSTESGARNGPPVPSLLSGSYLVSSVSGQDIYFNYQIRCRTQANQVKPTLSYTNAVVAVGESLYYKSIADNNQGNALTDPTYWANSDSVVGLINLSSSSDIFKSTDVGRQVAISTQNLINPNASWAANTVGEPFVGQGSIELRTEGGSWGGLLELQQSLNGGSSWVTLGEIRSIAGSYNGSIDRVVKDPASILRVKLSDYGAAAGNPVISACVWTITFLDQVNVYATIRSVADAYNAEVELLTPLFAPISDYRWALGVFSDTTGYPFSLTIHDERLCLGGSQKHPNTVYASRVNDWNNYLKGSIEVSPYTFTVASDSFDTIRSIKSSRQLNILTDNAENTMGSRDDNDITSITNISVSSHTNYGSNETQAIQLADMIWFVMGQGERVRASKYDFASDGQQSIEMSLFASHITDSGIKEMSFRRHPFNSLFCLLNNGTGAVLTYEGMQEVRAWATVKTEGNIISAASNYSDTGDIIAGVVERGGSYFLEKFGSVDSDTVFLDNQTTWTDANFNLGQLIEQDDDGNLIVVLDDVELVRDVDYTIDFEFPSQPDVDLPIGGATPIALGLAGYYYNLEDYGFSSEQVPYLQVLANGVPMTSGVVFTDSVGYLRIIIDPFFYSSSTQYTIRLLTENQPLKLTIPSQLTGDVCIGRRIECRVNPTDISEVAPSGMVKRLTELGMYLLDSGTCNVEINGKPSPFTDGLKWVAGQRESGLFELTTGGDYEQGLDINITIDGHRHFTLTGLGYRLGISQG